MHGPNHVIHEVWGPMERRRSETMVEEALGKPRHLFLLNAYKEYALTRCPRCQGATKVRRHCLVVHVEPKHLLFLNKSCRYCTTCDLIITRQGELESLIETTCERYDSAAIGNEYLVIGTVDRDVWRHSTDGTMSASEAIEKVHLFKDILDLKVEPGGWRYDPSKDKYRASDRKSR